jgi:hypothetical protein
MMLYRVAWQVLAEISAECTASIPMVQIQSTLSNIRKGEFDFRYFCKKISL